MSEYVKPNEKTVLLEPDQVVCHTDDKLRLLVIVYSSPVHYERRRVIRKTWGKEFSTYPGVKLVFLLGQSTKNLEKFFMKQHAGTLNSTDNFAEQASHSKVPSCHEYISVPGVPAG